VRGVRKLIYGSLFAGAGLHATIPALRPICGMGGSLPARMAAWQMGLTSGWLERSAWALTSDRLTTPLESC
jgi:hypothetical protein